MKHILQSLVAALMVLVLTSQVMVQDSSMIPAIPGTNSDSTETLLDTKTLVYTFAIMDNIADKLYLYVILSVSEELVFRFQIRPINRASTK